ncbi:MAG: hypothetical protein JWM71_2452, partial [Solirubrobacteraceae bacterium]|nr:hypothetical protein [Solirubrobacteraceae bacterium]
AIHDRAVSDGPQMRLVRPQPAALLALGLLAGCGAGHTRARTAHRSAAPSRCPAKVTAAFGPGATARVAAHEPQLLTCVLAAGPRRVRVTFDDLPQAWNRWDRAEVERTQTAVEWAHTPGQEPQQVDHVGAGAFWVAKPRQLVASDGRRLLTVTVLGRTTGAAARRLATRIAPAGLGPNHVPVRTGP